MDSGEAGAASADSSTRQRARFEPEASEAWIRTGGKQYRVAPGDVLRIEKAGVAANETIEFSDVLASSTSEGTLDKPQSAKVTATVLGDGRGDKILVFHFKRKKQYKKMQGHRQAYTSVRINEIEVDGTTYRSEK
jgi:large subunit ribosomal protein L21